jgi:hypothetical protein
VAGAAIGHGKQPAEVLDASQSCRYGQIDPSAASDQGIDRFKFSMWGGGIGRIGGQRLPTGIQDEIDLPFSPLSPYLDILGWHAFRRFRKTWLRGKRCQEDINISWMGHQPKTMSEVYSCLFEELEMRLAEAEAVGYGFTLPLSENGCLIPMIPKSGAQIVRAVAV